MPEYKPNSNKYRAQQLKANDEKKIEKVINGTAKVKKKSDARKFADVFISEDVTNVRDYIWMDVLVPSIKKVISEMVSSGIDMILYGESGRSKKSSTSGSRVSYRDYYDDRRDHVRDTRVRTRFDYDDLIFETRGEAESVREQMDDVIDKYGFVTVSDMYDMADITAPYTSNRYGWTNIRNAEIVRIREGYVIKLPKAKPID